MRDPFRLRGHKHDGRKVVLVVAVVAIAVAAWWLW